MKITFIERKQSFVKPVMCVRRSGMRLIWNVASLLKKIFSRWTCPEKRLTTWKFGSNFDFNHEVSEVPLFPEVPGLRWFFIGRFCWQDLWKVPILFLSSRWKALKKVQQVFICLFFSDWTLENCRLESFFHFLLIARWKSFAFDESSTCASTKAFKWRVSWKSKFSFTEKLFALSKVSSTFEIHSAHFLQTFQIESKFEKKSTGLFLASCQWDF